MSEWSKSKCARSCPICMCDIDKKDCLPCGHSFCGECISRWLENNSQCPMCRANPVFKEFEKGGETRTVYMNTFEYNAARKIALSNFRKRESLSKAYHHALAISKTAQKFHDAVHAAYELDGDVLGALPLHANGSLNSSTVMVALAEEKLYDSFIHSDWRSISADDALLEQADGFFVDDAEKVSVVVEKKLDLNGAEYFELNMPFDIPGELCTGGDPREREDNGRRCQTNGCACLTFVSKILVFDCRVRFLALSDLNGSRIHRGEITPDTSMDPDFAQALIFAHGTLLRKNVFLCARNLMDQFENIPPPFRVGDAVIKKKGDEVSKMGIVAEVVGENVRVQKGTWTSPHHRTTRARPVVFWDFQPFENFELFFCA